MPRYPSQRMGQALQKFTRIAGDGGFQVFQRGTRVTPRRPRAEITHIDSVRPSGVEIHHATPGDDMGTQLAMEVDEQVAEKLA